MQKTIQQKPVTAWAVEIDGTLDDLDVIPHEQWHDKCEINLSSTIR